MEADALQLAKDLIACPSITPEDAGALDTLAKFLNPLGFKCSRYDFDGDGSYPVGNLYARYGTGGRNLCFAGHTDVVPPGEISAWKSHPFKPEVRDGYLYGRGAEDMKSAIACFAAAAKSYITAHPGFSGSISFLITGDEEAESINGTRKVLKALADKNEKLDACIVGEPTNPKAIGEMAKIGRRGSISAEITVNGQQGHVAYPQLADNPVTKLLALLHTLKSRKLDDGNKYFQPSNLEVTSVDVGNAADNVIPATAKAKLNIRFNDEHTSGSLRKWIESECQSHAARAIVKFRVSGESFITPPGELSDMLIKAVKSVTGLIPELSTTGGTSDARFIKDYAPVIEFGTTGRTSHKVDENVAGADLKLLSEVYLRFIEAYFE